MTSPNIGTSPEGFTLHTTRYKTTVYGALGTSPALRPRQIHTTRVRGQIGMANTLIDLIPGHFRPWDVRGIPGLVSGPA